MFSSAPRRVYTYNVFIGSSQGLEEERRCFCERLNFFNRVHGADENLAFWPVRWEDTVTGYGRPQSRINEDLDNCLYALFIWHERWGSPAGGAYTSGTEEEFARAEELKERGILIDIALFFKRIDPAKLVDPGPQLESVRKFREKIAREKKYMFKDYSSIDEFRDYLEMHLASWQRFHRKNVAFAGGSFAGRPAGFDKRWDPALGQGKWKRSGPEEQLGMAILKNPHSAEYASFIPI